MVGSPLLIKLLGLTYGVNTENVSLPDFPYELSISETSFLFVPSTKCESLLKLEKINDEYHLKYQNKSYRVELKKIFTDINKPVIPSGSSLFIFPEGNIDSIFSSSVRFNSEKIEPLNPESFVDDINIYFKKHQFKNVFFIIPDSETDDRGIFKIHPFIRLISKNFRTFIGVIAYPPDKYEWIDWTYAIGVDLIWYEINCFDEKYYNKYFSGSITYEKILDSLLYSVSVFPKGCVFTTLIAGAEPLELTLKGVDFFLSRGVVPVIKTVPTYNISLNSLLLIYERLLNSMKRHRINPRHTASMSHIITPAELIKISRGKSSFNYSMTKKLFDSALRNAYKIRRNLVVREVK